eukprot:TRINITY_DN23927_c0_g4_i1.p1 TRINITY_DN23927_c0_g4~~TRINITY_DN23927_c0_g4_i1.p1  ORF type:complete len:643 (+),score=144.32 TRINITY_DN23927_c0_g4_i1:825-2753(+)
MSVAGTELQQQLMKLNRMFPEIDKTVIRGVVSSSRDEMSAVYRLLCMEERYRDPSEFLTIDGSGLVSSTSPLAGAKETSPQSGHRPLKSPEHADKVPQLQCPACSTQLSLPTTYPVNLICPTCKITFRQNSPPRAHPSAPLHRHDDNSRATWPACDYCGQQLTTMYERQQHVEIMHMQELEELRVLSEHVKRPLKKPAASEKGKVVAMWTAYLNEHVRKGMDNEESYNVKLQTAEQVEVLLKILFPEAQVYLFGSTVSGTSEKTSDVDLAVRLTRSDNAKHAVLDDALVIDSIWTVLTKEKLNLPWQHGLLGAGDVGLKKVTKTRVPILGNNPPMHAAAVGKDGEEGVEARRVSWQVNGDQLAVQSKLEKIKKTVSSIDPTASYEVQQSTAGGITILFDNQRTALAMKMKDPKASLHGIPNVFRTQWDLSLKFFGVRNSCLIKKYLPLPEHRLAAVAVKIWSRKSGINDPRVGLLSSYAVIILFIYYLLCTSQVEWIDPQGISLVDVKPRPLFESPKERADADPGAVLFGFFGFYATQFDWDNTVITLNRDPRVGAVTKKSLGWVAQNEVIVDRANSVRFHICIEDPYEQAEPATLGSLNLGRKVTHLRSLKVRDAFVQAFEQCFTSPDISPSELFAHPMRL